jgi:hypothetical protein
VDVFLDQCAVACEGRGWESAWSYRDFLNEIAGAESELSVHCTFTADMVGDRCEISAYALRLCCESCPDMPIPRSP